MSLFLTGTYRGVRRRLQGETALLRRVPGGYLAQFNNLRHREAFDWWFFPEKDFTL